MDLVVSKIVRLNARDRTFVEAIHAQRPLNLDLVEKRIGETKLEPAVAERAIALLFKETPSGGRRQDDQPPWLPSHGLLASSVSPGRSANTERADRLRPRAKYVLKYLSKSLKMQVLD
jgi:hypothetical protein